MSKRRRLPNIVLCESEDNVASASRRRFDEKSKNSKTTQGNLLDFLQSGDIKIVVHRGIEGGYSSIKNVLKFILQEAPETLCFRDNDGNTALMLACMEPVCPELIIRLTKANSSSLHQRNIKDELPLWAFLKAVKIGSELNEVSLETCYKLLEHLCKLTSTVKDNRSIMCSLGRLLSRQDLSLEHVNVLAEILLRHGAKIIAENNCYVGAKIIADKNYYALRGFHKITFNLMKSIAKYCPDDVTKQSQNCSVIKSIFVQYASRGFTDQDNSAVKDDLLKALKIVIQKPLPNPIGRELIIEAVNSNLDLEVIKVLVTQTQEFSFSNVTPGLLNKFATSVEQISELEELGYDFNVNNDVGLYPLHVAARAKSAGAVIKLLELGANPLLIMGNGDEYDDIFMKFMRDNESIFKVVLSALKNHEVDKIKLSSFYLRLVSEIHDIFDNTTELATKMLHMVMESINHNEVDLIGTIEYYNSYGSYLYDEECKNMTVDVVSYIIYYSDYDDKHIIENLYGFVKVLLECGYKVSDVPEDSFSALTTLLVESRHKNYSKHFNCYILPIVDLLIEYGVDVQSSTMSLQKYLKYDWSDYVEQFRQELCIPDALLLSMWYIESIELVQRLLVHWWGPPVALTAILSSPRRNYTSAETNQYYKLQDTTCTLTCQVWSFTLWFIFDIRAAL